MPSPLPQWDDDEQDDQDQQQLDPLGNMPSRQGPGPINPQVQSQRATDTIGPPPQMPKPKMWQRLLAGGLGAMAGAENVNAGRPGGPSRPIDVSGAQQAIYGVPGQQRAMGNWQNRLKMAEYQDTLDEKQREADMRDREAQARIGEIATRNKYYGELAGAGADQRAAQAKLNQDKLDAQRAQTYQIVPPTTAPSATGPMAPTGNPYNPDTAMPGNPIAEEDSGQHAANFVGPLQPGGLQPTEEAPHILGGVGAPPPLPTGVGGPTAVVPPAQMVPGGQRKVPMPTWAQGQAEPGSQAFIKSPAENMAEQEQAKLIDVPPELQSRIGPKATAAAIARAAHDANVPDKQKNFSIAALQMRAAGATTGIDEIDGMSPAQAHTALMAGPAGQNITVNTPQALTPQQTQALSQPPDAQGRHMELLNTLDPLQRSKVEMLINYDAPITAAQMSPRKGQDQSWKQASDLAPLVDPSWSIPNYRNRADLKKTYTVPQHGNPAANLISLDTLTGHLDGFVKDLAALGNGDTLALNAIGNWYQKQTGSSLPNNAALAQQSVAAELATALKGNATDVEIQGWMKGLSTNATPQEQQGIRNTILNIMYTRMSELQQGYSRTIGKQLPNIISPNAAKVFKDAGLDPGAIDPAWKTAGPSAGPGPGPGPAKPPTPPPSVAPPAGKVWVNRDGVWGSVSPQNVKPTDIKAGQ